MELVEDQFEDTLSQDAEDLLGLMGDDEEENPETAAPKGMMNALHQNDDHNDRKRHTTLSCVFFSRPHAYSSLTKLRSLSRAQSSASSARSDPSAAAPPTTR